jgi:glycosyltransferase involved in cell wall biosynthesis
VTELDWYCPLDKNRTEIARYALGLLPSLEASFKELRLFHEAGDDLTVDRRYQTHQYTDTVQTSSMAVYHFGNNSQHREIYRVAKDNPGIVVLHDCCLHGLALSLSIDSNVDFDWADEMLCHYGEDARPFVDSYQRSEIGWEILAESHALFEPFIQSSLGVIVHSQYAYDKVMPKASMPVRLLQLPFKSAHSLNVANYQADKYVIVFCGHAGPNRRVEQFIEALAGISDPEKFELHVYGNIDGSRPIINAAQRFGIEQQVEMKGFVTDYELDEALSSAHLAINLRYPTMGEASASQLRLWDHELPTFVTDIGWYSERGDNSVIKISIDHEIDGIRRELERFLIDPDKYQQIGKEGNRVLKRDHQPESYVQQFVSFVDDATRYRFQYSALVDGVVSDISELCDTETAAELFRDALRQAHRVVCLK